MWLFDFGVMRPTPFSLGALPQTLYPFLTKKWLAKCETLHGSQWLLQTKHVVIAPSTQQSFNISVMLWSSSAAYTDSKQTFYKNPCWNIQLNIDLLPLNADAPSRKWRFRQRATHKARNLYYIAWFCNYPGGCTLSSMSRVSSFTSPWYNRHGWLGVKTQFHFSSLLPASCNVHRKLDKPSFYTCAWVPPHTHPHVTRVESDSMRRASHHSTQCKMAVRRKACRTAAVKTTTKNNQQTTKQGGSAWNLLWQSVLGKI